MTVDHRIKQKSLPSFFLSPHPKGSKKEIQNPHLTKTGTLITED